MRKTTRRGLILCGLLLGSYFFRFELIDDTDGQTQTFVWTHEGTGAMKYLQWLVTRRLANVRLTRWSDTCETVHETSFLTNATDRLFIRVYLMPFSDQVSCSKKIRQIVERHGRSKNHIYFKRRALQATLAFQQLDANQTIGWKDARCFTEHFPAFLPTNGTVIHSEDLIEQTLTGCESKLFQFLARLGLQTSTTLLKTIVEHDSYQFIADATWWDRSEVGEGLYNRSRPSSFTYPNDFYHLHGVRSFAQYLKDTRRCALQGTWPQLSSPTISNRTSTHCRSKPYDCAFSDVFSLDDREQIYQPLAREQFFLTNPLKCGFAIPSIFDQIWRRYARNDTCQTIIITSINNCYDPLPEIQGAIDPSFCFVAIIDRRTMNAFRNLSSNVSWDLIDLGVNLSPFSVKAKTAATLRLIGHRLFPLAKWIVWVDGRARVLDLRKILAEVRSPFLSARHGALSRTSASEVPAAIHVLRKRWKLSNETLQDILTQEKQYQREGFYARSDALGLRMYDAALIIRRNHHPCIDRYLCAWHNEVSYFSFRVQLSIYYAAVRMNLTDYFSFFPAKSFLIKAHRIVC